MKVVEVEKLISDIKKIDLGYMQQNDVVECLEHLIRNQETYDIQEVK